MTQVVQVKFLGTERLYTYAWDFDPLMDQQALTLGDRVAVPPNALNPEGSSGIVAALGSTYSGQMARIVGRVNAS
ncbi:hypothetical protein ACWD2L_06140 [Streptomyces sp. NPDC002754]